MSAPNGSPVAGQHHCPARMISAIWHCVFSLCKSWTSVVLVLPRNRLPLGRLQPIQPRHPLVYLALKLRHSRGGVGS